MGFKFSEGHNSQTQGCCPDLFSFSFFSKGTNFTGKKLDFAECPELRQNPPDTRKQKPSGQVTREGKISSPQFLQYGMPQACRQRRLPLAHCFQVYHGVFKYLLGHQPGFKPPEANLLCVKHVPKPVTPSCSHTAPQDSHHGHRQGSHEE